MRSSQTTDHADVADRATLRLAQLAAAIDGGTTGPDTAHEPSAAWWSDHTRPVEGPPERQADPADPSVVPQPGRHASRRRGADLLAAARARLPTDAVGPAHLAVVALLVALAIGGTAWWLVRDRGSVEPMPTAATAAPLVGAGLSPVAQQSTSPTGSASARAAPTAGGSVTVDVVGKVRRPGIAVLHAGARVVDAIKAAGGARRGVDLSSLNLARVLVDGEQIAVGVAGAGAAPPGAAEGGDGATVPAGAMVNLNTATEEQLEALPEVGPVTAQAILAWREQNGGFTSVDQLLEVQGIGDKTLAQLTPFVTV